MTMAKEQATAFFAEFYGGEHHIPKGGVRVWGVGWYVNHRAGNELATFDSDRLTRLVFLAHDRAVRVAINDCGLGMVRVCIWQRAREANQFWARHPTLEQAVAAWRARHPAPDTFDTGDVVRHGPTGEVWLVAYVDGQHLAWCGWPSGHALVSDCTLVKKATPEERIALLRQLATSQHPGRTRAQQALEREGVAPTVTA